MVFWKFLFGLGVMVQVSGERQSHLVQCLHDIVLRQFTSELTCVVSYQIHESPEIESKILKDLNELNQPLLVVCNYEYDDHIIKPESGDKYGSYVLIHQSEDVLQDIRSQFIRLKSNSAWNSRALFVVVIMESVGLPPQNQEKVEKENAQVFAETWKHNVFEVIMLRSTRLSDENVRVDRGTPTVDVYTYFPYSSSGRCGQATDCVLLDTWVTTKDGVGHFLRNVSLFPPQNPRIPSWMSHKNFNL